MLTLRVVDEKVWKSLEARLVSAVATRPEMAPLHEAITRPVRLLRLMGAEAPGALGNDVLAVERLRLLLLSASSDAGIVALATLALRAAAGAPPLREPGLLHLGALAILGLAAARVAPDERVAVDFVATVHGLAVESSPVEMLARLEPYGAADEELHALLRMLIPRYSLGRGEPDFMTQVMRDPIERGRWACLEDLFVGNQDLFRKRPEWDVADHGHIAEVVPPDARPGKVVELRGEFPWLAGADHWPDDVSVVFAWARPEVTGAVAEVEVDGFGPLSIRVRVPEQARRGWIGFDHKDRHPASDEVRRQVAVALAGIKGPCFRHSPVPVEVISMFEPPPGMPYPRLLIGLPPRSRHNRYDGAAGQPGDDAGEGEAPGDDADGNGYEDDSGAGPGEPSGNGDEAHRVVELVLFRPVVVGFEDKGHEDPVPREQIQAALTRVLSAFGLGLHLHELPWVDDPLAAIATRIAGNEDARLTGMLEQLSRSAAQAPGLERAMWLAVLPGAARIRVHATAEAARAVAVATMAELPALIVELLTDARRIPVAMNGPTGGARMAMVHEASVMLVAPASVIPAPVELRPAMPRLRLVGKLLAGGGVQLESPREDQEREAALGAPIESAVSVVVLDAAGGELLEVPVRVFREGVPAHFAVLLPTNHEVAAIELRRGRSLLKRLQRSSTAPVILDAVIEDGAVRWSYSYAGSGRLEIAVNFLSDGIWLPILSRGDSCLNQIEIPIQRIARAERFRLVLSDGWNTASRDLDVPEGASFGPVAIRRVTDRLFWAELGHGGEFDLGARRRHHPRSPAPVPHRLRRRSAADRDGGRGPAHRQLARHREWRDRCRMTGHPANRPASLTGRCRSSMCGTRSRWSRR